MERINTPTAVGERFVDGNPTQGQKGTQVSAKWLNDVQEEISKVIEGSGASLDGGKQDQLLTAIKALLTKTKVSFAEDNVTIRSNRNTDIFESFVVKPGQTLDVTIGFTSNTNVSLTFGFNGVKDVHEVVSLNAGTHTHRLVYKNTSESNVTSKIFITPTSSVDVGIVDKVFCDGVISF